MQLDLDLAHAQSENHTLSCAQDFVMRFLSGARQIASLSSAFYNVHDKKHTSN
jgi:hypothetical protein